ncbi:MAG: methyltransferase type 11 [Parcubacteria group bacterium]|nr:methyltransferase type 11 [Parcubacteria group bacterium]
MSSEKLPKKLSGDVRSWVPRPYEVQDWEEITQTPEAAEEAYTAIVDTLKKYGPMLTPDSRVLEVGSGSGRVLTLLQEKGINAVGVDARPRAENPLPVVRARIERLPFETDTFDVIFSEKVFDGDVYSQDQVRMLREIARVLKPEGIYLARRERMDRVPQELELMSEKGKEYMSAVFKKKL